MRSLLFALLVAAVYVAAAEECNVKDELKNLIAAGPFLDSLQSCLNENPNDDAQKNFDKMKEIINKTDTKWYEECCKDKCSNKDMKKMFHDLYEAKDYLKEMKKKSDCSDIQEVIDGIQDIQDRCKF